MGDLERFKRMVIEAAKNCGVEITEFEFRFQHADEEYHCWQDGSLSVRPLDIAGMRGE